MSFYYLFILYFSLLPYQNIILNTSLSACSTKHYIKEASHLSLCHSLSLYLSFIYLPLFLSSFLPFFDSLSLSLSLSLSPFLSHSLSLSFTFSLSFSLSLTHPHTCMHKITSTSTHFYFLSSVLSSVFKIKSFLSLLPLLYCFLLSVRRPEGKDFAFIEFTSSNAARVTMEATSGVSIEKKERLRERKREWSRDTGSRN